MGLPIEQLHEHGEKLQSIGREFGVTTSRKRRCGWLDLVIVKYSTAVYHYTALNLTKLDIIDNFAEIQVATPYQLDGQVLDSFPADLQYLAKAEGPYRVGKNPQQAQELSTIYPRMRERCRIY